MRCREAPTLPTIISAALLTAGYWEPVAAGTPLLQRQEQSQRSCYADGVYTEPGQYGLQPPFVTITAARLSRLKLNLTPGSPAGAPDGIGNPIDQVGKLAESGGTPRGFNHAIRKIRQRAES